MKKMEKLLQRLTEPRAYPVGVSAEDVQKLSFNSNLFEDILECLESSELVDRQMGLFFSEILVFPNLLNEIQDQNLISKLLELSQSSMDEVRPTALKLLWRFHSKVPEYRNRMLKALTDTNSAVRWEALLAYDSYCKKNEVIPLESFENDSYSAEISMNGPLSYELRNLALETIERVIGKTFKKTEKTEVLSTGEVVFWWDWSPYHNWKKSWLSKLF